MAEEKEHSDDFDLYIDFVQGRGSPSRVFHSMGELIDAFSQLDQVLAGILAEGSRTEIVLDEVTGGSIRSKEEKGQVHFLNNVVRFTSLLHKCYLGIMKGFVAILCVLAAFPGSALACSLSLSPPHQARVAKSAYPPVAAHLKSVDLLPNIGTGENDSCDGVGFIVVTLTGEPFRKFKKQSFLVRPISGVRDPSIFPSYTLAAHTIEGGALTLTWGWVGITPDEDGEVRWRFQVIPVSPSGVQGHPLDVCVATDDSCATL